MASWTLAAMLKLKIDFFLDSCFLNRQVEMVKVSGMHIHYVYV